MIICSSNGDILVSVRDTGKGIPVDVIPKLFKPHATFGKKPGSGFGLGLYDAKTAVEAWGGKITIESEEGKGTSVFMSFPKATPPAWAVSELDLAGVSQCVVVDDDESVHEVWRERLLDGSVAGLEPESVKAFDSVTKFVEWGGVLNGEERLRSLFLIDLEFVGENMDGIDAVSRLGIAERAILVTRTYEDAGVRERCTELGLRLLPKMVVEDVGARRS